MAEFRSFERGMLVNGTTIMSVVEGVGVFQSRARRYLDDAGLHNVVADAAHWYSQQDWLDVFATIAAEVGANTLFSIGTMTLLRKILYLVTVDIRGFRCLQYFKGFL